MTIPASTSKATTLLILTVRSSFRSLPPTNCVFTQ
jgi:hypothetical protein